MNTACDFIKLSENWVRQHMSVIGVGVRLLKELRGESCLELKEVAPPKKGICTSRSFREFTNPSTKLTELYPSGWRKTE